MSSTIRIFLKRTVLFIGIPIASLVILLLALQFLTIKKINEYTLDENVTSAFIGDSHVQQAIDDRLISNSVNLSQKGESFYFSYYKIKRLTATHPHIKTIYLGFSYHSLSSYYEEYIFGRYSKDISSRYFLILPLADKMDFIRCNSDELPAYLKNIYKEGLGNAFRKKKRNTILGYYENNFAHTKADQKYTEQRLAFQFYKGDTLNSFSAWNIRYLLKIIRLCRTESIRLVMLNTPLHPYYKNGIPQAYIEQYNRILNAAHLQVIDFRDLTLSDSCFIPDGDHVSVEGSEIVSRYLDAKMK
jgi:hypothetical protein